LTVENGKGLIDGIDFFQIVTWWSALADRENSEVIKRSCLK